MTITVTADWVPDPEIPNDRPTDCVWVVEHSSVLSSVSDQTPYGPTFRKIGVTSLSATNSLETNRYTDDYTINSTGNPVPWKKDNTQRQSHLSIAQHEFDAEATASVPPSNTVSWYQSGCGAASIQYSAHVYTKGVALSREYARGEYVDADGTIHGDTVFSQKSFFSDATIGPSPNEGLNWQTFHAGLLGTWSSPSFLTWNWSPAYSGATINWNQWSMPFGGTYLYDCVLKGTPAAASSGTLTYHAQDPFDDGDATAKYVLTRHEPREITSDDVSILYKNLRPISGWYISLDSRHRPTDITLYAETASNASVTLSLEWQGEQLAAMFGALSAGVSFSYSKTFDVGGSVVVKDVPWGWRCRLLARNSYRVHDGTADMYDAGGFCGSTIWRIEIPEGEEYLPSDLENTNNGGQGGGGGEEFP